MQNDNWPPRKGWTIFFLFIFYFGSLGIWGLIFPFAEVIDDEIMVFVVLPVLAIYLPLMAVLWVRITSKAMTIKPAPGAKVISETDLRAKLLDINNLGVPFVMHEDKKDGITATWNIVDEKWVEFFAAYQIEMVSSLRLRFDDKNKIVRAQDTSTRKKKVINALKGQAEFSYSFFKGVDFASYTRGWRAGLIYKDGAWGLKKAYDFKFSLYEMKNPIIEAIGRSGWTYRPVPTFWRWWAG